MTSITFRFCWKFFLSTLLLLCGAAQSQTGSLIGHSSKLHWTSRHLLAPAIEDATNVNYGPKRGSSRPSAATLTPSDVTQQGSKADAAFAKGEKLRKEGSTKSFRQAIGKYEEAVALYRGAGNRGGEAKTLYSIGGVYDSLGEKQKALEFYNRVVSIQRELGDRNGESRTLNSIGAVYGFLGETQKALEFYTQALPINLEAHDREGEAITLNNIGLVYHSLGDADKALKFYNQALPLRRAAGDRGGEATTLNNIGSVYDSLGEMQKALEFFDQALPIYRVLGDRGGEAGTLNNIGAVHYSLGEKWKALRYFGLALPIIEAIGDRVARAVTLNNIGLIYHSLGFNATALEFCTKALRVSRAVGDRGNEARALNNIGTIYSGGGWEFVDTVNSGAPAIYPNLSSGKIGGAPPPDPYAEARASALGANRSGYRNFGNKRLALRFYLQALALRRAVGDRRGEAVSLNNIGIVYKNLGQRPKALDFYNQARLLAGALRIRGFEATTLQNLMVFWGTEDRSVAVFFGKQAVNVLQQLRSIITGLDRELQQTFLQSKEQTYRDLAGLLISEGRLAEAQQVLGLLKEKEYFEFVRDSGADSLSSARITFNRDEAKLEESFNQISARIAEIGAQRSALLAIKQRTPEQEMKLSDVEAHLEIANQAYQKFLDQLQAELKKTADGGNDVAALRESQALKDTLRELDAIALYTIVGEEKYNVILITPDVQKAYAYKINGVELNKKVYAFRQGLQNPAADPLPLARELYRILIGPELARDIAQTGKQTVVWSLDGALRYLPMAALHDGKKYLVESYRNVMITLASRNRLNDPVSPKWQALGLGVSKGEVVKTGSGGSRIFSPLPGVREELASIVRDETQGSGQIGVLTGTVLLDEGFTTEAMKTALRLRGNEQPFKLVHIASHFRFEPGDETKSFLLIGGGKTLTLAELKSMSQVFSRVELLTLSACNTAVGGEGAEGKEVEGFAVLAQRQGAEAIIASLWSVSDMSTSQLMRHFYRLRDEHPGMSKAEALRQAQLTLLRPEAQRAVADGKKKHNDESPPRGDSSAPNSHPYFWAPFILIGNWK